MPVGPLVFLEQPLKAVDVSICSSWAQHSLRLFLSALEPIADDPSHHDGYRDSRLARDGLQFFPMGLDKIQVDLFHVRQASSVSHGLSLYA